MNWRPFLAAVLVSGLAGTAYAQTDDDRAVARSTAEHGLKAFAEGNYSEAAELLARAESLVHAPTHLLYLARSLEKLGRLVEAQETYRKLTNERLPDSASKAFVKAQDDGRQEASLLKERIPHLTILITGAPREELTIHVNGRNVPNIGMGVPIPTNPGQNEIVVSAPGKKEARAEVVLDEGGERKLDIHLETEEAVAPMKETSAPVEGPADVQTTTRPVPAGFYIGLASTGILAAAGTVMGIVALDKDAAYRDANDGNSVDDAKQKRKQAQTFGLLADVSYGAAVVSGVVTTIIYFTRPSVEASPDQTAIRVVPSVTDSNVGLQLSGGF